MSTFINETSIFCSSYVKTNLTRMHSSRMRTGRSLTICRSLLPGGGVCLLRGVFVWVWVSTLGGVSAPGGCLLLGGGVCSWGGCLLSGGVCSGGLLPGGCLLLGEGLFQGGVCSWGDVSAAGGSAPGGGVCVYFWGCLLSEGCLLLGGVCLGVSALGGWYPSMHRGRHPHL